MSKALVLASGGLDSTVLIAKVVKEYGAENVTALNIYYGQKHSKEQEYVSFQANLYGIKLINADLSKVFQFSKDCPFNLAKIVLYLKEVKMIYQTNHMQSSLRRVEEREL